MSIRVWEDALEIGCAGKCWYWVNWTAKMYKTRELRIAEGMHRDLSVTLISLRMS